MRRKFCERLPRHDLNLINRFRLNPPQSIRNLAEQMGVGVVEIAMEEGHHGYLDERPDLGSRTGFVIFINKNIAKDEKRWALAHELGHYFLHRDRRSGTFDTEIHLQADQYAYWLNEDEEREADNFAEDLYFGGRALEVFVSLHGPNATLLAQQVFGVPIRKVTRAMDFYQKYRGLRSK